MKIIWMCDGCIHTYCTMYIILITKFKSKKILIILQLYD